MKPQDAKKNEFQLTPPTAATRRVIPIEPLYSMLAEAPVSALKAMLNDLNDFTQESQLEDKYESVGVNRRTLLEQVNLALHNRN